MRVRVSPRALIRLSSRTSPIARWQDQRTPRRLDRRPSRHRSTYKPCPRGRLASTARLPSLFQAHFVFARPVSNNLIAHALKHTIPQENGREINVLFPVLMIDSLLVTGFGPFEKVDKNPSEILARTSGRRHEILPVSYRAVTRFIEELDGESFSHLLMLGVHGAGPHIRVETTARNVTSSRPDVDGFGPNTGVVRPGSPHALGGTLWPSLNLSRLLDEHDAVMSYKAGDYLCNFIYYEALNRFPSKLVGFLHVPDVDRLGIEEQQKAVQHLIEQIEAS